MCLKVQVEGCDVDSYLNRRRGGRGLEGNLAVPAEALLRADNGKITQQLGALVRTVIHKKTSWGIKGSGNRLKRLKLHPLRVHV